MHLPLLKRITLAVALSGVVLSIVAGMIYGMAGLISGAAGALVAMANWQAIRWLAEQVTGQAVRSKGRLMILAGVKTTALMAVCWIALTQLGLDSRAFIIGISGLVAGIVIGPLTMPEAPDTSPSTHSPTDSPVEEQHG
ncbi:MAG: hypothetical protein ACI9KE_002488 [Polyangiales bacterium]|jgi:hypothetical protein